MRPRAAEGAQVGGGDLGCSGQPCLAPCSAEPSFCLSAAVAEAAAVSLPGWLMQASCGLRAERCSSCLWVHCPPAWLVPRRPCPPGSLRLGSAPRGRIKPRVLLSCVTQNVLVAFKEAATGLSQYAAGPSRAVPLTSRRFRVEASVLTRRVELAFAPVTLSHLAFSVVHTHLGGRGTEICPHLWHRGEPVPLTLTSLSQHQGWAEEEGKGTSPVVDQWVSGVCVSRMGV